MNRAAELLMLAEMEPAHTEGNYYYAKWVPVIIRLREKNWSFARIYHWLEDMGEHLPLEGTWTTNACQLCQRWTKRLAQRGDRS